MNEISWLIVFSNFLWILGAAVVLASFSLHEFLFHLKKLNKRDFLKKPSFRMASFFGIILIVVGLCFSFIIKFLPEKKEAIVFKDIIELMPSSLEGNKIIEDGSIFIISSGVVKSKPIYFDKAKYEILIVSKGSRALGETAQLRVYIGIDLIDDCFTSTEYSERISELNVKKKMLRKLFIEFANDYYDVETKEDRNLWIKSIVIKRK